MSITEHRERHNDAAQDDFDALVEFLEAQDLGSSQDLRDRIRRTSGLRFMLSKPLRELDPVQLESADPAQTAGPGYSHPPVSELSVQTKKAARKARPRKIAPMFNAVVLLVFWALLFFISIRFFESPLNYVLGAAFLAPIVLELTLLLRNGRHHKPR